MVRKVFIPVLFMGSMLALPAAADDDTLARFKGGIGVIPVSSGVVVAPAQPLTSEAVNRNFVRNVPPAGQIWVIDKLDARVRLGGEIKVKGKGLILGGGNSAGRATGQFVFATLICEAAAPFVELNTNLTGVQLAPNGDFEINDVLSPA
ncbi:MAG TPA: hypothetical protein VKD25_06560, partial [Burkholderiales bacterium]|nr:hypothetical protein [Burkholderiales bacterium]